MKRLFLTLGLSSILMSSTLAHAGGCDYTETNYVRYGSTYQWYDTISNPSDQTLTIQNVNSQPSGNLSYLNGGGSFNVLAWDIIPWASGVRFVESAGNSQIIGHPSSRSSGADFSITYGVTYNYNNAGDTTTHTECANYIITWCGDGITDSGDGEQCDDGAQNGQPGKCNTSCNGTVTPTPVPGQCGPVHGQSYTTLPTVGFCTPEAAVSPQLSGNTWTWTCPGQNGGSPASCSATKLDPPTCGSTNNSNNIQLTSTSPNLCPVGSSVTGFQANGTNPVNYSWTCANTAGTSPTCNASYTPPVVTPQCEPSRTGTQTSPLTQGYCAPGSSPRNFTSTTVGTTINYTWTCYIPDDFSPSPTVNCAANYTPPVVLNPSCNSLSVSPVSGTAPLVSSMNCGTTDATTVSINCGNGTTINGSTGICTYTNTTRAPVVYTPRCTVNGTITSPACTTNVTVNPPTTSTFDLSLKKYIDTIDVVGDAQTAPGISKNTGNAFRYIIRVKNEGPANTSNTTTVRDTFPLGVNPNGNISAPGWSCDGASVVSTITCTRSDVLASGQNYPDISVPVVVTATTGSVTNIATVSNPDENPANNYGNNNTDPAVFSVGPTTGFDLSIKKYVGDNDAQPGNAVPKNLNDTFNYIIKVKNEGPSSTLGETIVQDILPFGIASLSTPTGTGWTCSVAQKKCPPFSLTCINSGTPFTCSHTGVIAVGQNYPDITVPSQVTSTGTITNRAFVYNPNELNPCLKSGTPPTGSETDCTGDTKNVDPAVIIVGGISTGTGFDLSLKKYIGSDDAQTSPGGQRNTNDTFSYNIVVTNKGPQSTTGVTTVQDILPSGVVYNSTATGWTNGGWNCTYTSTGTVVRCTSSDIVASGASYSGTILIPVKVTAGANTTVLNIAAVDNPNEINRCNADGTFPITATASCTLDTTNSDPAYFNVPGGSSGGGNTYYIPTCVNGIRSCATQVHSSLAACNSYNTGATCYSFINDCNNANNLVCSGPGGPGPGGPGTGYCGDGVLGSSVGEECDLGNGNSDAENSLCSTQCKLRIFTNPGANPITDIWMTIPALSNMRLGYSWLDGEIGKIRFEDNRMVIGANTSAFTLADTVGFGIKTQYKIPLTVEADKSICLASSGNGLNSQRICTSFGNYSSGLDGFTNADGKRYILLGQGSYQVYNPSTKTYSGYTTSTGNPNSITLFKGPELYNSTNGGSVILRDAFIGRQIGQVSQISLVNISTVGSQDIPLVSLDVRVSGAMVGGTSSTVNRTRSLETYLKPSNDLAAFLAQFTSRVKGTSTTTTATTYSTASTTTANINISSTLAPTSGLSISSVANLSPYTLNGNPNIFSVKGNVTIENCGTSGFVLSGVRTLIVDGNLTIKCNIGYGSNDTTSSWAFITKNGDIRVYNGQNTPNVGAVTNLAGVYVAIPGTSGGGNFTYDGAATTTSILRLNGSMYGNANPLFQSRLYVRGTNAYDILTTGVILSYSNRALVNPPPLLSNFLNNYSVSRVVR